MKHVIYKTFLLTALLAGCKKDPAPVSEPVVTKEKGLLEIFSRNAISLDSAKLSLPDHAKLSGTYLPATTKETYSNFALNLADSTLTILKPNPVDLTGDFIVLYNGKVNVQGKAGLVSSGTRLKPKGN